MMQMPTHSLQLLNFPRNYEKGNSLYGPGACIVLKTHSKVTWHDKAGKRKNDFIVITPQCVIVNEFRNHVKRLIKELEIIEKQAEKLFKREMDRKRSKFANRT